MLRDPRAYLWDMRDAASAIQEFVAGMNSADYASSVLVQSAVERKFEIIGEALAQLAKLDPVLAARVPHLSQIIAFRNQLVHGYAVVKQQTVWNVVQDSLPPLVDQVHALLLEIGEV